VKLKRPFARLVILICCCWGILCWWRCWRRCPATTLLLIRHADPAADGTSDPPLSLAGQARAAELVHIAGDAGISAIFATEFQRTRQTAEPLASHLGLTITSYSAFDAAGLVDTLHADHSGSTVLVVGHSNTVPEIVELLGGGTQPAIGATEFNRLFVTVINCRGHVRTVRLRYGE
jgi:broad specificity phosphatase PhoE